MDERQQPRRTTPAIKRFNVWFGAIFLSIGVVALVVSTLLYLLLPPDPRTPILAILAAPMAVGLAFSILGGTFMSVGLRRARMEERLLQVGTIAEATIVAIERTGTRVNRRHLWRIRYVYDDQLGGAREGESGYLSAEDAQSYQIGEQAFIRYDPEQPASSMWLGREAYPS